MKTLIENGVGFDVAAMAQLTVEDFKKIHTEDTAIGQGLSPEEKDAWLTDVYAKIQTEKDPVEAVLPETPVVVAETPAVKETAPTEEVADQPASSRKRRSGN